MSHWTDKPSGLSALLDEARGDAPTAERLDGVQARLEAELGTSLGSASTDAEVPTAPRAPTVAPLGAPAVAMRVLAAGVVAVAVWLLVSRDPAATPTPSSPAESVDERALPAVPASTPPTSEAESAPPPPPPTVAPASPLAPAAPTPSPLRTARETGDREARAEPTVLAGPVSDDPGSTLREEIALLERAMAARDAGDTAAARAVLELHRTRFPEGVLSPERERVLRELAAAPVAPDRAAPDPAASP